MVDPRSLFDLTGKVACITGASSGLGRRAAVTLAAAGAHVVGVARRGDALETMQDEIGAAADFVVADIADRDHVRDLCDAVSGKFGSPDIVIQATDLRRVCGKDCSWPK